MKKITINTGFITNSSSCIHHFDRRILEEPEIKLFIEAYGIENGYVGNYLWGRGTCQSFIVNEELRKKAQEDLNSSEYSGGVSAGEAGNITLIYGDEYSDITSELCKLMEKVCERIGKYNLGGTDYN